MSALVWYLLGLATLPVGWLLLVVVVNFAAWTEKDDHLYACLFCTIIYGERSASRLVLRVWHNYISCPAVRGGDRDSGRRGRAWKAIPGPEQKQMRAKVRDLYDARRERLEGGAIRPLHTYDP